MLEGESLEVAATPDSCESYIVKVWSLQQPLINVLKWKFDDKSLKPTATPSGLMWQVIWPRSPQNFPKNDLWG